MAITIDKAIEVLNLLLLSGSNVTLDTNRNAVKLGIEALKREKNNRDDPNFVLVGKLPREEKE
jgi:hypothetical protein